jgi:hypothetical protein
MTRDLEKGKIRSWPWVGCKTQRVKEIERDFLRELERGK